MALVDQGATDVYKNRLRQHFGLGNEHTAIRTPPDTNALSRTTLLVCKHITHFVSESFTNKPLYC